MQNAKQPEQKPLEKAMGALSVQDDKSKNNTNNGSSGGRPRSSYVPPHKRAEMLSSPAQDSAQRQQQQPQQQQRSWGSNNASTGGGGGGSWGGNQNSGGSWGSKPQGAGSGGYGDRAEGGGYGGGYGGGGRSGNFGGSGGGWSRAVAGVGSWDPQKGHVHAPRDPNLEAKLFKTSHVSSGINFDKYNDIPVEATGNNVPKGITDFSEASLDPLLISNIELANYTTPTPVQKFSLPIVEAHRDLMACAQTGSGKTAGFLFPILNECFKSGPAPRPQQGGSGASSYGRKKSYPVALIMSPTRELTIQIFDEAKRFAYRSWVRPVVAYGGANMSEQLRELSKGCDLLVATPGRLMDMLDRGYISLACVRYLILDEADRMLDMGFEPQIRDIVEQRDMPPVGVRNTLMFSATFPRDIQVLARDFLADYVFLSVGRVGSASENVTQKLMQVEEREKDDALLDILYSSQSSKDNLTLIFVETKRAADLLANFLYDNQFPATAIHGDRTQKEREQALLSFRSARTPILVATAVAARGLDIPNVTHVINYDLPSDIDDYVHRIGRTGRAGNMGTATSFFNMDKNRNVVKDLVEILREANQEIPQFLEEAAQYASWGGGGRGRGRGGRGGGGGRGRPATRDYRRDDHHAPSRNGGGGGGWGGSHSGSNYGNSHGGGSHSGNNNVNLSDSWNWGPPPSGSGNYGGGW
ncbi:DEAD-box ATP-dependent RNA helicase [Sorochytrium milnesiophthora]